MVFQCINIRQVPWEVLKTAAFGTWRMLMHEKPCLKTILVAVLGYKEVRHTAGMIKLTQAVAILHEFGLLFKRFFFISRSLDLL